VGIALLNTACGLKAPLYLPDEKEQQVTPSDQNSGKRRTPPKPAPQGPKQDRIDGSERPGDTSAPTPPDPDPPATPPPPAGT
jgi:predicted small lipoprotein YifL